MSASIREGRHAALVIANPHAGRGRAGRELAALIEGLRAGLGAVDVACTQRPGHASELASSAHAQRRPLVICFGGDGTLSEIAHGLLGGGTAPPPAASLPRLGLIAAGTGSDFGRGLGLPATPRESVAVIAGGAERSIDAGWATFRDREGHSTRRVWLNVLSAGLGGYVDRYTVAAPALLPGRVAYAQATLRAIVRCDRVALRCRAQFADGNCAEKQLNAYAVVVCNGTTFGAGMRVAPMARPDDGLLEVITVETASKLRMLLRLSTVYGGRHLRQPGIAHFSCRSLSLTPSAGATTFPLDVDGDALGDVPVEIGLLPRALRLRVPPASQPLT